ncbi:TIGR02530 family flagellar biosynthesis protein [Brevibacillus sp. SYSU BS000544]|uniref:TIGR02530 family flagellar biosynthesis protein n=1 Tax=Brevibacillus sp. SYSU BS000544 TaxID=3416443 RepID=UPI003CE531F1
MNNQFRVGQTYFPSKPGGVVKQPASTQLPKTNKPFEQWLKDSLIIPKQVSRLSFSQHALNRLQERGIVLGDSEIDRLEGAVEKAAAKGAKESLVIMDNVAYVVNIANRKVITAVDDAHMKESVFTNIDSAVLV